MDYFGQNQEKQQYVPPKRNNYLSPDLNGAPIREELISRGLIPLDQIESLMGVFEEIAFETGIPQDVFAKIKERLFLNPLIPFTNPRELGGFHTVDKYIEFNPKVLSDPNAKLQIAHVFFHEYMHMSGISDEAITEMMTIRKMKETYGQIGIVTGYVEIVEELEALLGDKDFDDLFELMNREESKRLDAIVAEIVLKTAFEDLSWGNNLLDNLKVSNLLSSARIKWAYIMRLFPRLINEVDDNGANPFDSAAMSWFEMDQLSIMESIAEQLFMNPIRMHQFLQKIFEAPQLERNELLGSGEYSYIFEFANTYSINLYTYYDSLAVQIEGGYEM